MTNHDLSAAVDEAVESWDYKTSMIGPIFVDFAERLPQYWDYIHNMPMSMKARMQKEESDKKKDKEYC